MYAENSSKDPEPMSIPAISFQAAPFRARFSPAPTRSTCISSPLPRDCRLDQSCLQGEGDDSEGSNSQGYMSAVVGNFAASGLPSGFNPGKPAVRAGSDLRAALRDWLPEYSPYLNLATLED